MRRLLLLCASLLIPGAAAAVDLPPALGAVAPAFGLYPFEATEEGQRKAVFLDHVCGLQENAGRAVLVSFVDRATQGALGTLNGWAKGNASHGLTVLGISTAPDGDAFGNDVRKAGSKFQVLDDRYGIVANRYGVRAAPRTYLLNSECRVMRSWTKPIDEVSGEIETAVGSLLSGEMGGRSLE